MTLLFTSNSNRNEKLKLINSYLQFAFASTCWFSCTKSIQVPRYLYILSPTLTHLTKPKPIQRHNPYRLKYILHTRHIWKRFSSLDKKRNVVMELKTKFMILACFKLFHSWLTFFCLYWMAILSLFSCILSPCCMEMQIFIIHWRRKRDQSAPRALLLSAWRLQVQNAEPCFAC